MRNPFYDLLAGENSPRRKLYSHEEPMDISRYFGTKAAKKIHSKYPPNHYHNVDHAAGVAHVCVQIAVSNSLDSLNLYGETLFELIFAALMHDARHSGGVHPDSVNIRRAIHAATDVYPSLPNISISMNNVAQLISVTEFDSSTMSFVHVPVTQREKIIRDADLMAFTTPLWPRLLLGLMRETGNISREANEDEIRDVAPALLRANLEFLHTCTFYTEFGRRAFSQYDADVTQILESL